MYINILRTLLIKPINNNFYMCLLYIRKDEYCQYGRVSYTIKTK